MSTISFTLPPGVNERTFWSFMAASANSVPSATAAIIRRANNDGYPVTEEQARAVVLFMRGLAGREFARLAGAPSNGITFDIVGVNGDGK
jgi:hypothetical protein